MKITSIHKPLFPILLSASLLLSGCGKEEAPEPEVQTPTQEEQAATTDISLPVDEEVTNTTEDLDPALNESLQAFGYVMCLQLQMEPALSEAEAKALAKGVETYLAGKNAPENLQQSYISGAIYVQQRMQEKQNKVMQEKQAIADTKKDSVDAFFASLKDNPNIQVAESGLYFEIIDEGDTSKMAVDGDEIKIHYKGTLIDGREFDSSYTKGEPVVFPVARVIPGFSEGCKLIGEGGKIKLYIPNELAYKLDAPEGSIIEPGDPLIFEVELLKVMPPVSEDATPEVTE